MMLFAVSLLGLVAPAWAQAAATPADRPVVVFVGGYYGAPTRWSGGAGLLIGRPRRFQPGAAPDASRAGVMIAGGAGAGGVRVAAGVAGLALEGPYLTTGFDALFTATRTNSAPRGASADSTYVGAEAGLVLMSVRLSAGVAHRVAGDSGSRATVFTWSAGVQIPVGW